MIRFVCDVNDQTIVTAGSVAWAQMTGKPPSQTFKASVDIILPTAQGIDAQTISFEGDSAAMLHAFETAHHMLVELDKAYKNSLESK
jgi:hypothetical protein